MEDNFCFIYWNDQRDMVVGRQSGQRGFKPLPFRQQSMYMTNGNHQMRPLSGYSCSTDDPRVVFALRTPLQHLRRLWLWHENVWAGLDPLFFFCTGELSVLLGCPCSDILANANHLSDHLNLAGNTWNKAAPPPHPHPHPPSPPTLACVCESGLNYNVNFTC